MGKAKNSLNPARFDFILRDIEQSVSDAQTDLRRRNNLIKKLEQEGEQPRRVAMYYSRLDRDLNAEDILPFSSMLKHIGRTERLDLIIHSPGGDGLTAEKMLDLCRRYCTGMLRVVVPLYAKSAATLVALGADEILMGETSELGPIDAQVFIIQDGQPQQVSADHFIRAEAKAISDLGSTRPQEVEAAKIQLASMSPAFLQHCLDSQNFGKTFARKQLQLRMFGSDYTADIDKWGPLIEKIVENLTASSKHLSHGRMITASDIRADADLSHLKIKELCETDPYWQYLDELLVRTDVVAKSSQFGKILFARKFQLVSQ